MRRYIADSSTLLTPLTPTRRLREDLDVVGQEFTDPTNSRRCWTVDGLYAPIQARALGGVRLRVKDQKGFVSYINQRDAEVLLNYASAGELCGWLGSQRYLSPSDINFWGLCIDPFDMEDEIVSIEAMIRYDKFRARASPIIPTGYRISVPLHLGKGEDVLRMLSFTGDMDPGTMLSPDLSLERAARRWQILDTRKVDWSTSGVQQGAG